MVSIEEDSGAACAIYGDCERVLAALGSSNSLSIDTKYFTVQVSIFTSPEAVLPETQLPINAVLVCGSFDLLESVSSLSFFDVTDVRLFMPSQSPSQSELQFCFDHQVEYLDLENEPERVLEAMNCSVWPGAKMKSSRQATTAPSPAAPTATAATPTVSGLVDQGALLDELDELCLGDNDDFGALLSLVGRARQQGSNLTDSQRRENAERLAMALASMLEEGEEEE